MIATATRCASFTRALEVVSSVGFWNVSAPFPIKDLEGMALDLYAKLKDEPPGFQQDVCEKFSSLLLTLECCTKWHHDRIFEKYLPFLNKEVSEIIIHDDNELDDLEDAQFLIDEILMDDSLNVIYGPSNDAKTVAAMGMCFSAITGAPWMGRDVHRTGPAFYINSEAFNETKDRKNAWKDELGLNGQRTEFYGIDAELDLAGAGTRDVDRLIESIRAKQAEKRIESVRPGIIVIDTLARNFGNEDENATQSMNRFVRHCDRIRKEFRCPVIVIHHTGINDKRERGNRALRSACYTMIEVKRVKKGQDLISFSCIKMRGAPFFKPISMRLTVLPHIGKKGSVVLRKGDGGGSSRSRQSNLHWIDPEAAARAGSLVWVWRRRGRSRDSEIKGHEHLLPMGT